MKVISYQRPDGGVSIVYPNPVAQATEVRADGVYDTDNKGGPAHLIYPGRYEPETEAEFLNRVAYGAAAVSGSLLPIAGAVPADAVRVEIMEHSEIPTDRSNRDNWSLE